MKPKFSILLASRERVGLLDNCIRSIEGTVSDPENVEVFIGIDQDDKQTINAIEKIKESKIKVEFYTRERSPFLHKDYINKMFYMSSGKFIIVLNDDTLFINKNWDTLSETRIERYLQDKNDRVLYCKTQENTGDKNCCCFPLVTREACLALGFVMPDERANWGADNDMARIFSNNRINRILSIPEIKISHITHHNNTRERDKISLQVENSFRKFQDQAPDINYYVNKLESYIQNNKKPKENRKILVVYNTCEMKGRSNYSHYIPCINSILSQDFDSFKVVISGCKMTKETKDILFNSFGNEISYNWIEDKLPLNTTFNHTVMKAFDHFGEFESVLYMDSGIYLNDKNILKEMWNRYETNKYSMIAQQVDSDTGYSLWKVQPSNTNDTIINPGQTVNLHIQLFGKEIFDAFDKRILPDIFASDTSESIFPYICACFNKKMVLTSTNPVHHKLSVDGPSVGFRNVHDIIFKSNKPLNVICALGYEVGFGYEECKKYLVHNRDWYDHNYNHKDPERLKSFIKQNCYFDKNFYQQISHLFIGNRGAVSKKLNYPAITAIVYKENSKSGIIDMIKEQTSNSWEIIVVGPGAKYVEKTEKINKIEMTTDVESDYINAAVKNKINGEIICYLKDSDVLYNNAFESVIQFIENNNHVNALYTGQDVMNGDIYIGEKIPDGKKGAITGKNINNLISNSQFYHKSSIFSNWNSDSFKNSFNNFIERIGNIYQIHPLETKTCMIKI